MVWIGFSEQFLLLIFLLKPKCSLNLKLLVLPRATLAVPLVFAPLSWCWASLVGWNDGRLDGLVAGVNIWEDWQQGKYLAGLETG